MKQYSGRKLAWTDLFVLTGRAARNGAEETQGMVYIEAQATGLPVVAADVGGVAESMVDRETGLLVESGHIAAIAEAIMTYASNQTTRLEHGSAAREFVLDKFDLTGMLDGFEGLYSR